MPGPRERCQTCWPSSSPHSRLQGATGQPAKDRAQIPRPTRGLPLPALPSLLPALGERSPLSQSKRRDPPTALLPSVTRRPPTVHSAQSPRHSSGPPRHCAPTCQRSVAAGSPLSREAGSWESPLPQPAPPRLQLQEPSPFAVRSAHGTREYPAQGGPTHALSAPHSFPPAGDVGVTPGAPRAQQRVTALSNC